MDAAVGAMADICSKYRGIWGWRGICYMTSIGMVLYCSIYKQLLNSSPGRRIYRPGRGIFICRFNPNSEAADSEQRPPFEPANLIATASQNWQIEIPR